MTKINIAGSRNFDNYSMLSEFCSASLKRLGIDRPNEKNVTISDMIDNQVETCTVQIRIDDSVANKHFVLCEIPGDDDDDDRDNDDLLFQEIFYIFMQL
jgi:hypothetical protein